MSKLEFVDERPLGAEPGEGVLKRIATMFRQKLAEHRDMFFVLASCLVEAEQAVAFAKPWTKDLWIYDLRTNQHFTLKTNPLANKDLDDFKAVYHPKTTPILRPCHRRVLRLLCLQGKSLAGRYPARSSHSLPAVFGDDGG